jgi:hypothetical protein
MLLTTSRLRCAASRDWLDSSPSPSFCIGLIVTACRSASTRCAQPVGLLAWGLAPDNRSRNGLSGFWAVVVFGIAALLGAVASALVIAPIGVVPALLAAPVGGSLLALISATVPHLKKMGIGRLFKLLGPATMGYMRAATSRDRAWDNCRTAAIVPPTLGALLRKQRPKGSA